MRGKVKRRPVTQADLRKRFLKALIALPVYLPAKLPAGWTKQMLAPTPRLMRQYLRAEADVQRGVAPALILLAQGYDQFYTKLNDDQRDALHEILFECEKDPKGEAGLGPPLIERLVKDRKAFNGKSPNWSYIVRKYSSRLNWWPHRLRRVANAAARNQQRAMDNKARLKRRESRQAAYIDAANEALEKNALTEMEHRLWTKHAEGATQKELRAVAGVKTQGAVSKQLADLSKILADYITLEDDDTGPLYPPIFTREGPGRCNLCGKPVWWVALNGGLRTKLVYYEPTNLKTDPPHDLIYPQHLGGTEPPPHGTVIPAVVLWMAKFELIDPNEKNYDRLQPSDQRHRCGTKDPPHEERRKWLSKVKSSAIPGGTGWPGPVIDELPRDLYPVVGYPPVNLKRDQGDTWVLRAIWRHGLYIERRSERRLLEDQSKPRPLYAEPRLDSKAHRIWCPWGDAPWKPTAHEAIYRTLAYRA